MVWVGPVANAADDDGQWKVPGREAPAAAAAAAPPPPAKKAPRLDMGALRRSIEELNALAGEGTSQARAAAWGGGHAPEIRKSGSESWNLLESFSAPRWASALAASAGWRRLTRCR